MKAFRLITGTISVVVLVACAMSGMHSLRRHALGVDEEVRGSFRLILYGGTHGDDLETLAVLDLEGDSYTFEPYAPEFDFRIKEHLSAQEALDEGSSFASLNSSVRDLKMTKIVAAGNAVVGYEIRPLHEPITYGIRDVLDVSYLTRNGTVHMYVRLKHFVRKAIDRGDGERGRW